MAAVLVGRAASDETVSGATVFLENGDCRYLSVEDALAIVDLTPPAGSA